MYGLLYKELILQKKQIISIAAVIILFSAVMFTPFPDGGFEGMEEIFLIVSLLFIVLIFAVVGMLQQGIFEIDERKKWQFFICSTPLGKQGQVRVKYIFTLATSIITTFYCILIHSVACVVQGCKYTIPGDMIIAIMITQLILRSIEFPFFFRFGSKYGNNIKTVMASLIVFGIVVYLLFGDLSMLGSKESFFQWLLRMLSGDSFSTGVSYLIRLSPCIGLIIYYLSYKISCRLYIKGGDYYDK